MITVISLIIHLLFLFFNGITADAFRSIPSPIGGHAYALSSPEVNSGRLVTIIHIYSYQNNMKKKDLMNLLRK